MTLRALFWELSSGQQASYHAPRSNFLASQSGAGPFAGWQGPVFSHRHGHGQVMPQS